MADNEGFTVWVVYDQDYNGGFTLFATREAAVAALEKFVLDAYNRDWPEPWAEEAGLPWLDKWRTRGWETYREKAMEGLISAAEVRR